MPNRKRRIIMLMIGGNEPQRVQEKLVSSCLALAQYFSADLEVFAPSLRYWPLIKSFSRLKKRPRFRVGFTAFGDGSDLNDEIKAEIQSKEPILFVLDRNHIAETHSKKEKTLCERVLAEVSVPTLMLMCERKELKIPFRSLFVPMSGEVKSSSALEWSINFANEKHVPVDLLHVTHDLRGKTTDPSPIGKFCDQFYHEYPRLVYEFVAQGSPYSSFLEKKVIRHFYHCTGLELKQIVKCGLQLSRPLVVVEWKGNLEKGHAKVLKGLLAQTDWPILLTKQKKSLGAHLKMVKQG